MTSNLNAITVKRMDKQLMVLDSLLNALDVHGSKIPEIRAFRVSDIHGRPVYNNRLPRWIKYALENAGLKVKVEGYLIKLVR